MRLRYHLFFVDFNESQLPMNGKILLTLFLGASIYVVFAALCLRGPRQDVIAARHAKGNRGVA